MTERELKFLSNRIAADARNVVFIKNKCRDMRTIEHVVADCASRYIEALDCSDTELLTQALDNLSEAVRVARLMSIIR